MCINMCISNLPLGALQCTIQLSIMPPHPPQKNKNKKKNRDHILGSRRSFVFQTERSDTKYMIFSFYFGFPFSLRRED